MEGRLRANSVVTARHYHTVIYLPTSDFSGVLQMDNLSNTLTVAEQSAINDMTLWKSASNRLLLHWPIIMQFWSLTTEILRTDSLPKTTVPRMQHSPGR